MSLFTTERLLVRRLTADDVDAMLAIYGDRETVRFVGDAEPLSEESCREWVAITDRNFERRGYGMVAFADRATGDVVGCGGIVHPGQQEETEIKYAFRRDQWGKGYATEVLLGLLAYAQDSLGLRWLMATVDPGNISSQNVLQKVGFTHTRDRINDDDSLTQIWEFGTRERLP